MSGSALEVEGLVKRYGGVRAVDGLDLRVAAGSFVTLLGPSGCGKSTTLNLIAGLDQPDAGAVRLGDRDITSLPPNERGMAMVFQNYALYPNMSVFDNIGFSLRLQRRPRAEIRARVGTVAEALDVAHLLDRRPGQLSGGQQQRVALGRALVKHPEAFLLDEPFSNLDAGLRARMRAEVKQLHLSLGTTSLFVTHDQEEAMALSDMLAVMRAGAVVQYGTPHEVYSRPRNVYVATFVGKPRMSLVDGRIERVDGRAHLVAPGIRIALDAQSDTCAAHDGSGDVTAGFRAEDVRLLPAGSAGGASFDAVVRLVEPMGADTFVQVAAGEASVVARITPDTAPAIGENVCVAVSPGRVHLFDRTSGDRLTDRTRL